MGAASAQLVGGGALAAMASVLERFMAGGKEGLGATGVSSVLT